MPQYSSVEDLINAGYGGYQGWRTPEALADYRTTGGQGKFTGTPGISASIPGISVTQASTGQTFDPIATARQLQQFQIEAAQPAIAGLKAGIEPLKQRYTSLIEQIQGKAKRAGELVSERLSREYGQRGIPLASDVFQRQLQREQLATEEPFTEQIRLTEAGKEQDLASIAQQIAQLQAGQPATATQQALNLLQTQAALAQPAELQTEVITVGGRKKLINRQTGEVIADLGVSTEGMDGLDLNTLATILGGGTTTPTEPKPTYKPGTSTGGGIRGGFTPTRTSPIYA